MGNGWVNCKNCYKSFNQKNTEEYCCKECRDEKSYLLRKDLKSYICGECGIQFSKNTINQKFCNKNCNKIFHRKLQDKKKEISHLEENCHDGMVECQREGCNNKFIKTTFKPNQKFCSKECLKLHYKVKRELNYFDIFKHDGFRCQYCGKTPRDNIKLVIDHVYPLSHGGKEDRFNLITSCNICNTRKHNVLLPKGLIVSIWNNNKKEFTYEEAKEFWLKDKKLRGDLSHGKE